MSGYPILQTGLTKLPPPRLGVCFQQFIDYRVEIHQPCILSKIVLGFPEEHVRLPVRSANRDLSRFRKRSHDFNLVRKLYIRQQQKKKKRSARTRHFSK